MVAVADDILTLRRAFDDAELRGDADRLDELLADDFLSIGEQGYQLGKREWIGRHRDFRYLSVETTEPRLRQIIQFGATRSGPRSASGAVAWGASGIARTGGYGTMNPHLLRRFRGDWPAARRTGSGPKTAKPSLPPGQNSATR